MNFFTQYQNPSAVPITNAIRGKKSNLTAPPEQHSTFTNKNVPAVLEYVMNQFVQDV